MIKENENKNRFKVLEIKKKRYDALIDDNDAAITKASIIAALNLIASLGSFFATLDLKHQFIPTILVIFLAVVCGTGAIERFSRVIQYASENALFKKELEDIRLELELLKESNLEDTKGPRR